MAIMPVLIIPFAILIYRERVSLRAVFGAVLAVAGVAMLFLWPGD
jgi:drug/metabolite transporter (DMT)-like permease